MKYLTLCFVALFGGLSLAGQATKEEMLAAPEKTAGVYYAYPAPKEYIATPPPKGYVPFYISHFGRHGSRFLLAETDYTEVLALMEKAAWTSLAPYLNEGESTVGTKLEITHDSASPLGIKVWAESEVTEVDRKRIVLKVAAYDEKGLIGQGLHERFIITDDRFLAKAGQKLEG